MRKKIALEDGSIVSELITPTPDFSNQQEELLNGWSGGGEGKMRGGEKRLRRRNYPESFLVYKHLISMTLSLADNAFAHKMKEPESFDALL